MCHIAVRLGFLPVVLVVGTAAGAEPANPFEEARKLEAAGKNQEAFLGYLAIPGAQHVAARMARSQPQEYLALLRERGATLPAPFVKVIEGDLRLATGDKAGALGCYQAVAQRAAMADDQGWTTGHLPRDAYLVEPPTANDDPHWGGRAWESRSADPFEAGPGSHRDNWLIRRFIALEAWADVGQEFQRVWAIHRRNAEPYRVRVPMRARLEDPKVQIVERLVRPRGFDSRGLQFALDYAFFLQRNGQREQALSMLQDPLLRIDMDRNPNVVSYLPPAGDPAAAKYPLREFRHSPWRWGSIGVSRKEFVRLAYGVFKDAGHEQQLVALLQERITAGENRLRRVLARIRFHQGQTDAALALELDFLKYADVDQLTVAYRRGLVYDEAGRPADAAAAFEQVLRLPYAPLQLPDADEVTVESSMRSQAVRFQPAANSPAEQAAFHAGVLARLERLYGALGQPDKALASALQGFERHPGLLERLADLEQAQKRAAALNRETEFRDWAARQLSAAKSANAQANLYWVLKDYEACVRVLKESWRQLQPQSVAFSLQEWLPRFRSVGKPQARMVLSAALEADPKNARVRLELLDLSEQFGGPEVIAAFESLLDGDAEFAFARGKGDYNRTRFRNYFDLAYRLLRLYEQAGLHPKFQTLALRIAAGEKPFAAWWKQDPSESSWRDDNGRTEDLNACLSLIVQNADAGTLARLAELWKDRRDCAANRQLARRQAGAIGTLEPAKDIGWQHLPPGVRLIASSENVLALARDGRYVYVGHPWGVGVYRPDGEPVTRIALGEPVEALAAGGAAVWAGTPRGLYKIAPAGWTASHLWLHDDVPPQNRYSRGFPGPTAYWFENQVYTLVLDGEDLWIGLHRNIQRLNTRTLTLRAFSYQELQAENWLGISNIIPDGPYVWAGNRDVTLRYDRAADTWARVSFGKRGASLIGLVDGLVFASVWLDDKLRFRPCLIDRQSLNVTPLLIDADSQRREVLINEVLSYYGKLRGQVVLGAGGPGYTVDVAARKFRPLPESWQWATDPLDTILPEGFRVGRLSWSRSELPAAGTDSLVVRGDYSTGWTALASGDGVRIAGRRYEQQAERLGAMPNEKWGEIGGLYAFAADGRARRVSQAPRPDRLDGDVVFDVVAEPGSTRKWACTDNGLAVLDAQDRIVARLTRDDGLAANRITSGVWLDGRFYGSASWGDHGGGLVVFDPQTAVLTGRFVSDGLATNKLARIEAAGDRLRLIYGVEYGRSGNYRYRQFPPGAFDPRTGTVVAGADASFFDDSGLNQRAERGRGAPKPLPLLGGAVLAEHHRGGKTYLCGDRGLVILEDAHETAMAVTELAATLVVDPQTKLKEEAKAAKLQIHSPQDLTTALASTNPYLRARAVAMVWRQAVDAPAGYVPVLAGCLRDPHLRPRATALFLLSEIKDPAVVPALQEALRDKDRDIRAVAVLALARRGHRPPRAQIEELLTSESRNYPFDADSSLGVLVGPQPAYETLAPLADEDVFRLFLQRPPTVRDYDNKTKVFPPLGAALRRHPEAAQRLLRAYDDEGQGRSRTEFAQEVFRCAGPPLLPVLHEALQSRDRIVRSNAARGCGAIGDRSSIPRLLKAFDLESGLAWASLVWALGELKAQEALPKLAALYVDARNDEQRQRSSGFRMAQAAAQFDAHVEALKDPRSISAEWDELQSASRRRPIDPRHNEPLLDTRTILEAVATIGPESSQEFYRVLAGERDAEARAEAAVRLAEGAAADRARNLPVLRNLLADPAEQVPMAAAVSLLLLGETDVREPLLAWLAAEREWQRNAVVLQLERVQDGTLLCFAREALARIAQDPRTDAYQRPRVQKLLERIPTTGR